MFQRLMEKNECSLCESLARQGLGSVENLAVLWVITFVILVSKPVQREGQAGTRPGGLWTQAGSAHSWNSWE